MDFTLETLTAAINEVPHLPTELRDSGLFAYGGVATTSIEVESDGYTLRLVQSKPRGGAPQSMGRKTRKTRTFKIPHFPQADEIFADEVQNVRAFGTQNQPDMLSTRIAEVLTQGANSHELTMEYHRWGALAGIVYDADGSVLYDFFEEFGVAQNTLDFVLDNAATEVRTKCSAALDSIGNELGGVAFRGADGWCGTEFFDALITHKTVKETWLATAKAADQAEAVPDTFSYGGILWHRSRARNGNTPMVPATKARIVPRGVPNLLLGRHAPANYNETVNTVGLPMYAKAIEKRNGTGYDLEMQGNTVHLLTRPRAVIEASI